MFSDKMEPQLRTKTNLYSLMAEHFNYSTICTCVFLLREGSLISRTLTSHNRSCGFIAGAMHTTALSREARLAGYLFHSFTLVIAATTHPSLFLSLQHITGAPEEYLLVLRVPFPSQTILVFAWGQKLC